MLQLPKLSKAKYSISITAFGNRENAFGSINTPEGLTAWFGPKEFRTDHPGWWKSEYNIKLMVVLTRPQIEGQGMDEVLVRPRVAKFVLERAPHRLSIT